MGRDTCLAVWRSCLHHTNGLKATGSVKNHKTRQKGKNTVSKHRLEGGCGGILLKSSVQTAFEIDPSPVKGHERQTRDPIEQPDACSFISSIHQKKKKWKLGCMPAGPANSLNPRRRL